MGLSGLVGAGAVEGLEDLLARQLLEQQQAERVRAQKAQEAQQQARLAFDQRRFEADDAARQQDIEQSSIQDMRQNADRMDARMTRLQGEEDQASASAALQEELAQIMPSLRPSAQAKARLLGPSRLTSDDLVGDDEQAAADTRAVNQKAREAAAVEGAKARVAAKYQKPNDAGPSAYTDERNTRTRDAAFNLLGRVNQWTTGAGSLLSNIPATDARNFAAELDTLKANIAFNELAEMRAASKTGGALGAVSDKEMRLLESALGALDTGQSPAQFKAQLQRVVDSIDRFNTAKRGGASAAPAPVSSHGGDGGPTIRYERGPDGKLRRVP